MAASSELFAYLASEINSQTMDTHAYTHTPVGYLACVLLLSETNEFLRLVINSVKNDLMSHNEEIQSLALACVAKYDRVCCVYVRVIVCVCVCV